MSRGWLDYRRDLGIKREPAPEASGSSLALRQKNTAVSGGWISGVICGGWRFLETGKGRSSGGVGGSSHKCVSANLALGLEFLATVWEVEGKMQDG